MPLLGNLVASEASMLVSLFHNSKAFLHGSCLLKSDHTPSRTELTTLEGLPVARSSRFSVLSMIMKNQRTQISLSSLTLLCLLPSPHLIVQLSTFLADLKDEDSIPQRPPQSLSGCCAALDALSVSCLFCYATSLISDPVSLPENPSKFSTSFSISFSSKAKCRQ